MSTWLVRTLVMTLLWKQHHFGYKTLQINGDPGETHFRKWRKPPSFDENALVELPLEATNHRPKRVSYKWRPLQIFSQFSNLGNTEAGRSQTLITTKKVYNFIRDMRGLIFLSVILASVVLANSASLEEEYAAGTFHCQFIKP